MPVPLDPPQARLNGQQRTGHPALLLVGAAPAIDLVGVRADLREERLQAVGGLQADAEGAKQAHPVQGERLLQTLIEAADRRLVEES